VLAARTGVCLGYANLYHALAARMGLESHVVLGHARAGAGDRGEGHAWNAVRLAGKDYLLDATWGSGYLDSGSGRFVSRLDMAWWCRAPAEMIKTHLPDQARWQLLPKQVTRAQFNSSKIE